MKPTMAILERISKNSQKNKDEVFTRLYRYLLRPDIYYVAYQNLYANKGAATKGVIDDTADGFSEEKIKKIIQTLKDEAYQPQPVRRIYIAKKNSKKMRPLGIPTFTDKLIQEAVRIILESIYEPVFEDVSHGFRPQRSCHTALKTIKREFGGARWFVEGDIKGCFDNIDHATLIGLINLKIKDMKMSKLIYKFLKAGYLEHWQYHKTYSGTPQGGILSPLLANIYLHELDKFVLQLKMKFDQESPERITPEYRELHNEIKRISHRLKKLEGEEKAKVLLDYQEKRKRLMTLPCTSQTNKVLKYVRYADDFIISVKGSKGDCQWIKNQLSLFIHNKLKMDLSEEKTLITHSSQTARFLGYDIRVRRSGAIKRAGKVKKRTLNGSVELLVPLQDKIRQFIFDKKIAIQKKDGSWFPVHRKYLIRSTDLEIITIYNSELRGICNYYSLACNFNQLGYFAYLMEYSCLKTIASKHKGTLSKTITMYKDGSGSWGIPYETKRGKRRRYFAKFSECKSSYQFTDRISQAPVLYGYSRNTLENRLKAKQCELCGTTDDTVSYEIHHVNKVKNLKGKEKWEMAMIAKQRKTLVVCFHCHRHVIHKNK
ncbi:Retron-type RNA-directed DNA polymerase [Lactococcus lactis subsp. lactis]|uniref:Maturase MatR n=4 Tax=Lactococcus lactis TaxID=1358 RepID=A0A2A5S6V9_LACLH|nr:reverse transcriptase domain-containing protein [Lactococcus lactis]KSU07181.1 Retron-type RNA-directed DNA polymerase [Lactococcus lactis subsp. lactis]MCT3135906.1 group II intron reverse transcriptase/maturase [Lactococcus lactis]PCS09161.1 maturase MatR [Lactococcus lactis subsp. hordniae]